MEISLDPLHQSIERNIISSSLVASSSRRELLSMACSSPDDTNSVVHSQKSYLATVGIDFGTTYSGFAFSFNKDQGEEDAIFMNREWVNELGHRTSKTPTCLLLNPDLSFDSFGYKAVEKYANLRSVYEEKEFFFFQHFKMILHNNEDIDLETTLYAANWKRVEAKAVFAHSIKFLSDEALNLIRHETGDDAFKVEDIQWVLTVPAIWTPRAKQFMRLAAYEAGIVSPDNPEQLVIALEPEAAAIFCTEKKMDAIQSEGLNVPVDGLLSRPNSQYMVVDIGDDTNSVVHSQKSYLATVGIDFGTTYSGFAFSFNKDQGEEDAIFMNREWVNELGHRTSKTPTCLLLNPDLSFDSFGYKAVEKYANLRSVYEEKEFFFFQHFKMILHNNEDIDLETTLYAANWKRVEAKAVFAHSIKFLSDEALNLIRHETGDDAFKVEDIQWVLTVPAIWTPRAKQFMRLAAYEAGIVSPDNPEQLVIALEPEAAAIFCTEKKMDAIQSEGLNVPVDGLLSRPNSQYMVVDIGGGTLDVTVHENQDDGTIKEIHKVTGGPYGGLKVNHQFESLLNELFGDQELYDYRKVFPVDWLRLKNDFEEKKRSSRAMESKETRILLPRSFASSFAKIRPQSQEHYGADEVNMIKNEYLSLSPKVMVGLFNPVLEAMKDHLLTLLNKPELSKVKAILLVGGFAVSPVLQQNIRSELSKRYRVIIPRNADKAVVQGAVMFGKMPSKITARVVCMTYGTDCSRDFIEGFHPEEKKFVADGIEKCRDLFACFVKENETVKLGQRIRKTFNPVRANDTVITFGFYTADDAKAQFVTEPGLTKIGSVTVQSPDTLRGRKREIEVSMYFGGTEITATTLDVSSGNVEQITLDFFYKL